MTEREPGALRLMTLRADSQFNTTIYNLDDRFRGIKGCRMVLLMNRADMQARSLQDGGNVTLQTIADAGIQRRVEGLRIVPYDIPAGLHCGLLPGM